MNVALVFTVSIISGLYTSCWGVFKDSPYEGFKIMTFLRSIFLHIVIFFTLYSISCLRPRFMALRTSQIFFLIMGIERLSSEIYKGFFRNEDQSKYLIPSRITFLGKYITSNGLLYSVGVILVAGTLALLFLDVKIEGFIEFCIVSNCTGLAGAFGGAYKDAPFEGFKPLGFLRTPVVLLLTSPLFYFMGPVSLGFLIYMNLGLERFIVEYYKTYIQRTMSGKFRSDLQRSKKHIEVREKYHYIALFIILGVIVLIIRDIQYI